MSSLNQPMDGESENAFQLLDGFFQGAQPQKFAATGEDFRRQLTSQPRGQADAWNQWLRSRSTFCFFSQTYRI